MPAFDRRQFLRFAGSTLAALTLNPWELMQQGDRYAQVLAQGTPRKLALLVGINQYPAGDELAGAVTDVELQRQLLIYRFGFNPADIHTLVDAQATRQNILTAFEEHLIQQARPGDVVVFHFSGHGSRVDDRPDCDEVALKLGDQCLHSSFVPVDNPLSLADRDGGGTVLDITGHTLFLLMAALQTDQVTAVLDCCHAGGGKRGNLRMRALDGNPRVQTSPAEQAYRRDWLARLKLQPAEYLQRRRAGVAQGVVIAAGGRRQLTADYPFEGFSAGAFTYLLTQYLWQHPAGEPLSRIIANTGRATTEVSFTGQVPEFEAQLNRGFDRAPMYFVNPLAPPAEAVITSEATAEQATVWLGGVDHDNLAAFDQGAIFTVLDRQGHPRGQVQLEPNSRTGLKARGKPMQAAAAVQPGSLLQERVRGLPKPGELKLQIALDPSLGPATAEAQRQLQAMPNLQVVPARPGQGVDYVLGRTTPNQHSQFGRGAQQEMPPVGSIGLFTPGNLALIPGSFATPNEALTAAIARLQPKFKSLMAAHLLRLILNPRSSGLSFSITLVRLDSGAPVVGAFTRRGAAASESRGGRTAIDPDARRLPLGTQVQIQITNSESRDVYLTVLVIDAQAQMDLLFPNAYTASESTSLLRAGATLQIPDRAHGDRFHLTVVPPVGRVEVLAIASTAPFGSSLLALRALAARGERGIGEDPRPIVETLLEDLSHNSRGESGVAVDLGQDRRGLDMNQFAALSVTFDAIVA